ncbi:hypothetical protein AVEN_80360-1 [Araneus ventricosus]|uniref:Uncharacterized protein n=1 Tax=Araneus ventricosus TaxID=182803 RepID=A0A4Y2V437_ARAVE|nr:hypothetical protein AVEN_80360-1 [Araneus ventricosus]
MAQHMNHTGPRNVTTGLSENSPLLDVSEEKIQRGTRDDDLMVSIDSVSEDHLSSRRIMKRVKLALLSTVMIFCVVSKLNFISV